MIGLADNHTHRAFFMLPPPKPGTELAVQEPPPAPQRVTGDAEIDAVLWLRQVIDTGDDALVAKAMEGAKRIKTPLSELEKRYAALLVQSAGGHPFAVLSSFGFGDLKDHAERAVRRRKLQREAIARFGSEDGIFKDTEPEQFCIKSLRRMKRRSDGFGYADKAVDERFNALPDMLPASLDDCVHELWYWHRLYELRNAFGCDNCDQANAREWFAFRCLGRIPPRSSEEAIRAFDYMVGTERMDQDSDYTIMRNLVGGPR